MAAAMLEAQGNAYLQMFDPPHLPSLVGLLSKTYN